MIPIRKERIKRRKPATRWGKSYIVVTPVGSHEFVSLKTATKFFKDYNALELHLRLSLHYADRGLVKMRRIL